VRNSQKITLLCVPYAGGSAEAIFSKWQEQLGPDILVKPLEYAGHGKRMVETFKDNLEETVNDLLRTIIPLVAKEPYALYAHSMGCSIVYELLRSIDKFGLPSPQGIYLSGRKPPHMAYKTRLHTLSDREFLDEIKKIGGTSSDFFKIKELISAFLPILKNDYKIIEQYQFNNSCFVSDADISFFFSDNDAMIDIDSAGEWSRYTKGDFFLHKFEGKHFFIHDEFPEICRIIRKQLCSPPELAHVV